MANVLEGIEGARHQYDRGDMIKLVMISPGLQVPALAPQKFAIEVDGIEKPVMNLARVGRLPVFLAVREHNLVGIDLIPAIDPHFPRAHEVDIVFRVGNSPVRCFALRC
jgi:hypothetical protein